jgi:hypothetical protein
MSDVAANPQAGQSPSRTDPDGGAPA